MAAARLSYEPNRTRSYLIKRPLAICLGAAALCVMAGTQATGRPSLLAAIDSQRAHGCQGRPGVSAPLRSNSKLDAAARRLARGEHLTDALDEAGYRAKHSASLFLSMPGDDADFAAALARTSCAELVSEQVRDIGIERRGHSVWIILAAPFDAPELRDAREVAERVLQLTNKARSQARRCGSEQFAAAPPLTLSPSLSAAAREHARDMARHSMLSHQGSDGSTPALRISREHYAWRAVAENVASGPTSAQEVVDGWVASPGHCENLMSPRYTQMGIAYTVDPKSEGGVYWAQEFGRPR